MYRGYFLEHFPDEPISSLHIPKAAGSALKFLLYDLFSPEHVLVVYPGGGDMYLGTEEFQLKIPLKLKTRLIKTIVRTPVARDIYRSWDRIRPIPQSLEQVPNDIRAVHGHMEATWFREQFPTSPMIAMFREPYQRALSHYRYWRQMLWQKGPHAVAPWYDENTSLRDFVLHPDMQNYQAQWLAGVPLDEFQLIGTTERYRKFVENLCFMLNVKPPQAIPRVNKTALRGPEEDNAELEGLFRDANRLDYELYDAALLRDEEITREILQEINNEGKIPLF